MAEVVATEAKALQLNSKDNTATALTDIQAGESCPVMTDHGLIHVTTRAAIPFGHKLALQAIEPGQDVIKYGEVIGEATQPIAVGDHVHVHNVVSRRGRGDLHKTA